MQIRIILNNAIMPTLLAPPCAPLSAQPVSSGDQGVAPAQQTIARTTSAALLQGGREIEIAHAGRIYRLRLTQLNKLILTA